MDQIADDEELKQQVRGFIGQEGHHSFQHNRINAQLTQMGFDALRLEKHLEKDIQRLLANTKRGQPKVRLALTVGMEHLTAIMAEHLLNNPELLDSLEDNVKDLLLWHAVEEIEHKSVAFDVYQRCVGNDELRNKTLRIATAMFVTRIALYMVALLWWAREVPCWKDIQGFYRFMFSRRNGLIRSIRKPYREYFKKGFHPWNNDNRNLIESWKQHLYRKEQDRSSEGFDPANLRPVVG